MLPAPGLTADFDCVLTGETVIIDVLDNDMLPTSPDSDSEDVVEIVRFPDQGLAVVNSDNKIEYTAIVTDGENQTLDYKIRRTDNLGGFVTDTITVSINVNDPIEAMSDTRVVDNPPPVPVLIDFSSLVSDADNDIDWGSFTNSDPSHGVLIPTTDPWLFTYQPVALFEGDDEINYTISENLISGCGPPESACGTVEIVVIENCDILLLPSISGASEACVGEDTLVLSLPGVDPSYTYSWNASSVLNFDDDVSSDFLISSDVPGTYTVSVVVTDPATMCSNSANVLVTFNAKPSSTIVAPATVCPGVSVQIDATDFGDVGATTSYSWSDPLGIEFSTVANPFVTANPGDSFIPLEVAIENDAGCSIVLLDSIEVSPSVFTGTPLISGPLNSCLGAADQFSISGMTDPVDQYEYIWSLSSAGGGIAEIGDGDIVNVSWFSGTSNTLEVIVSQSVTGCQDTVTSSPVSLSDFPPVLVDFANLCLGDSLQLTLSDVTLDSILSSGDVITGLKWTALGSTIPPDSSLTTSISYLLPNVGPWNFLVELETSYGCVVDQLVDVTLEEVPTLGLDLTDGCLGTTSSLIGLMFPVDTALADYSLNWFVEGVKEDSLDFSTNEEFENELSFSFPTVGTFPIQFQILTSEGCEVNAEDSITILSVIPGISSDLETNTEVFTSAVDSNSWTYDTVSLAWITDADAGTYFRSEKSEVNFSCLELDPIIISRPMVELFYQCNTDAGKDGAALQYMDEDQNWITIGEGGSGLDWYTDNVILGDPGEGSADGPGISLQTLSEEDIKWTPFRIWNLSACD